MLQHFSKELLKVGSQKSLLDLKHEFQINIE